MIQRISRNFLGIFRAIKMRVASKLSEKIGIFRKKKRIMPLNKIIQWHYDERDEV
jgi:hypothetical protein